MSLLSIDIARLIHHHLLKEGYENSANNLISECPHLKGLKPVKPPYKLPRLLGPSLADLLESYFESKDYLIEELDNFANAVFRDHDSLLSLSKTLIENLKSQTPKETSDASVNTESIINEKEDGSPEVQNVSVLRETCDASVNTELTFDSKGDIFPQIENTHVAKETCDVSVNTETISCNQEECPMPNENLQHQKETCDASVNTEPILSIDKIVSTDKAQAQKETCDTLVGTDLIFSTDNEKESSPSNSENTESAKDDLVDFSLVYDRLLEDREFQEKIAENINKKKAEVILPDKESSRSGNLASAQDLNAIIKAIVAETQADPAFDNFLKDCIGIDSEDPTPVGTPDSTDHNEIEPTASPLVNCITGNQENLPLQGEDVTPLISEPLALYCTIQDNNLIINPTSFDTLNNVTIVTPSGQVTLVPATVSAVPPEIPNPTKKKGRGKARGSISERPIIRRPPIAIAPKPTFTITIPDQDGDCHQAAEAVPSAVSEAVSNFVEEFRLENPSNVNDQQLVPVVKPVSQPSPGPSKSKPLMKIRHRTLKRSRKTFRPDNRTQGPEKRTANPTTDSCPGPPPSSAPSQITPALAELLKIAQEACKSMNIPDREPEKEAEVSESQEVVFSTPVADSCGFVTTPTSTRRRSHVRQLNFGESPELSEKPASKSPTVHSKQTEIVPWDCALRNAIATSPAAPPPDSSVFATPKGKAKRAKKQSPTPLKEIVDEANPIDQTVTSTPTSTSSSTPDLTSVVCSTPMEKATTSIVPAEEPTPRLCVPSDTSYADLVAASILNEMANTPMKEIVVEQVNSAKDSTEERVVELRIPEPNLPHFGMGASIDREGEPIIQQLSLPVLATPRKEMDVVENHLTNLSAPCGNSSTGFGSWDGEIPRTPQIRLDLTNSTSPFQVSLTKGFRFLPAADSPSLAVPATPCIFEANSTNTSIETPYTGFYQFPSVLNTPRLEAIRQEMSESPSKSLSITMISPTQVVLGRSTPYFVPSGERAQGPVVNYNATPEHIPEPVKFDRRRRSSTDMDPLQLEESNDASDAAAELMCKAAASVAAALQSPASLQPAKQIQSVSLLQSPTPISLPSITPLPPLTLHSPSPLPSPTTPTSLTPLPGPSTIQAPSPSKTPYKTDQTLENDLINECRRLEDVPSTARVKLRNQRLIELFGEDSTNPSAMDVNQSSVPENTSGVLAIEITPTTTNLKPRRSRKKTINVSEDPSTSSGCARVQGYSASQKPSCRRSQRSSNKHKKSKEKEKIIQEVLALGRVNTTIESEKLPDSNKRKRKSDSFDTEQKSSSTKTRLRRATAQERLSLPGTLIQDQVSSDRVITEKPSTSRGSSPSDSSRDELEVVDIDVSSQTSEPTASVPSEEKNSNKTTKMTRSKKVATKQISPVKDTLAARRTPVKLFKSAVPPCGRKAISLRQSAAGLRKSPRKQTENQPTLSCGVDLENRENVSKSPSTNDCAPILEEIQQEKDDQPIAIPVSISEVNLLESEGSSTFTVENINPVTEETPNIILPDRLHSVDVPVEVPAEVPAKVPAQTAVCEDIATNSSAISNSPTKLSPRAVASKDKNRRSNSKHQNYLRLSNLSKAPPKDPPVENPSLFEPNAMQPKAPTNLNRQSYHQQKAAVIHKDLVNKMRKKLGLSEEVDIYSQ